MKGLDKEVLPRNVAFNIVQKNYLNNKVFRALGCFDLSFWKEKT